MADQSYTGKIGDLLVDAGLLSREDLKEGTDLSATLGLPIGKTMVMSGLLSAQDVRSAVLIQSMLKDGLLDKELALQALSQAAAKSLPVEDCLIELGWRPAADEGSIHKIADLLVEAGVIGRNSIQEAMDEARSMNLPLSRLLVLTSRVRTQVVWCTLNAQLLIRENKINKEQAVNAIRAAHERQTSLEQGLKNQGLKELRAEHRVRLGELLVLSGIVNEEEILGAVEESVIHDKPLGQILVSLELLDKDLLNDALKLPQMTDSKELSPLQAVDILRSINRKKLPLSRIIAEFGLMKSEETDNIKLGELLQLCGWISSQDIDEVARLATKNSNLLGKMLVSFGLMDESLLHQSLRCQFLIREKALSRQEAVLALDYCRRTRCTLDDAINELGFKAKTAQE